MIKIEKTDAYGWETAIRGMRNSWNSWDKSDSEFGITTYWDDDCTLPYEENQTIIGNNDLALMKKLSKAGTDHSKYLRMINVTCDILAPLYFWKEFDTYKVGTVSNSCSTMHTIADKEFTLDDFSCEHLTSTGIDLLENTIDLLNDWRDWYVRWNEIHSVITKEITSKKDIWWQIIQLLPSSYNQKRTVQMNYQVLKSMYHARKNHKLDEWREFCKFIKSLPYAEELICCD